MKAYETKIKFTIPEKQDVINLKNIAKEKIDVLHMRAEIKVIDLLTSWTKKLNEHLNKPVVKEALSTEVK